MHLFAGLSFDHAVISDFAMGLVDVTDDGSPALGLMLVIKNKGKMLYLDPIDPQCFKKTAAIRKADSGTYTSENPITTLRHVPTHNLDSQPQKAATWDRR